jgi:hypothetical protein
MKFTKQHLSYLVGAQLIGAPPIYRPGKRFTAPLADKSAPTEDRIHVFNSITGDGHGEQDPSLRSR